MSCVFILCEFNFCGGNKIGSKDTEPLKMDVFLFEYIMQRFSKILSKFLYFPRVCVSC